MKTIKIYEPGDKVFWLNGEGFQSGYVKDVMYEHRHYQSEPKIAVVCKTLTQEGDGDVPEYIFQSKKEMAKFYLSTMPKKSVDLDASLGEKLVNDIIMEKARWMADQINRAADSDSKTEGAK